MATIPYRPDTSIPGQPVLIKADRIRELIYAHSEEIDLILLFHLMAMDHHNTISVFVYDHDKGGLIPATYTNIHSPHVSDSASIPTIDASLYAKQGYCCCLTYQLTTGYGCILLQDITAVDILYHLIQITGWSHLQECIVSVDSLVPTR